MDRLKQYITKVVESEQQNITYGTTTADWPEIEVDEVTLQKRNVKDKIKWSNYIGMIQRGLPSSLWIERLPDRFSSLKSPGPGPIQSKVWNEIAKQKVDGRGIILHSDSARAYLRPYKRMAHTRVVHCRKWKNGAWTKPHFTKNFVVKCDHTKKAVRGGTQIIDGVWRLLRKGKWGVHGDGKDLNASVRWTQWRYWKQNQDLFQALGETFANQY